MTGTDSPDAEADPVGAALWQKVIADFDNDVAHQKALDYARQSGKFADLATRYRALLDRLEKGREEDIDVAQKERCRKRLAAIALVAAGQLKSKQRQAPPSRILMRFIALALIAIVVGSAWALATC